MSIALRLYSVRGEAKTSCVVTEIFDFAVEI